MLASRASMTNPPKRDLDAVLKFEFLMDVFGNLLDGVDCDSQPLCNLLIA